MEYGTYPGDSFDRGGLSVPARSQTALRWSTVYASDGDVATVEDPREKVSFHERDAAGRRIREVRNYEPGVNGGAPTGSDVNVTTRWAYAKGLMTSLTADLPSGQDDQVTRYVYGTKVGTPSASKIATGHLLRAAIYPDSSNLGTDTDDVDFDDTDLVSHAYDAQEARVQTKDQAGNVIATDYDLAGRPTARRIVGSVATGFDELVVEIERAYDGLGRLEAVVQHDEGPDELDGVKYAYDGWGNLTAFRQDWNSAVDASGSVDDQGVGYAWAKATTGRNTLRRSTMTLPSGRTLAL